jgi:P-type Mg2+ transporter
MKEKIYTKLAKFFSRFLSHKEMESTRSSNVNLREYSQMIIPEIFQILETNENGLVGSEAKERLEKYGLNEIAFERPPTWYRLLLISYVNPFNILVTILGFITFFLGDIDGTIIIAAMVILSVGIRFIQEFRSNLSAEKLKSMVSTKATIIRQGDSKSPPTKIEIPFQLIVPGDIIFLSAGDMLPADVFLISSKDLYVSQSALTGEAMPVEKFDIPIYKKSTAASLLDTPNMCFMGTNVLNGTGLAVVIATGNNTFFGSMAKSITGHRPMTSFDIGINKVSWLLIRFMFIMAPVVFLINGATKGNWFEAFLFALSVAVGLVPEMLPMIVTTNLARGAMKMAQSKVIVKRLNSIQNFGAMNILCTDKTGTLTQDRIILEKHLSLNGKVDIEVLQFGFLNSYYQTGLKNLLDLAVLEHKEIKQELQLEKTFRKVDEIPFDFMRRRMSVVLEKSPQVHLLICKGAVEEMVDACKQARFNGEIVPFTEQIKKESLKLKDELNEDGLRVLAVAYKEIPAEQNKEYKTEDEDSLVLLGFLAFLDPPKKTAEAALAELRALQVQVKVLTGDNEIVTKKICKWVGLNVEKVLNGHEIDSMNDEELKAKVDETTIFVKVSPLQKSRIISMLKANGNTVGFLGDGINDAPALREADVGISVDTAVDIAKESADIIMLEKSLMFLKDGVLEGRKTFGNILKYIKMAVSSNFGNVFSILGSSAILPFLPMMPLQLLFQNLLYDISQITIPFDNIDPDFLKKPRKWDPGGIAKFMIFIGPISSIFDYTTFAVMWFVFGANSPANQALFQTGWFVEGLLSQTLIVHMIRTKKIPFIQSIASPPLLLTTALIMAVGIYIPYTFVGASLAMVPLPGDYYYWLLATLICYCGLVQLVKVWFIKRFQYWI